MGRAVGGRLRATGRRARGRAWLAPAAALLLGALAWSPAADRTARVFGPVEVARFGQVVEAVDGTLTVARRERLLAAPAAGRVRPLAAEGQVLPAGALLAVVEPEGGGPAVEVRAPFAGVVSFYADGQERWDWPELALGLSAPAEGGSLHPLFGERPVALGQPVARLVDHGALRAVFWARHGDKAPWWPPRGTGAIPKALRAGAAVELAVGGDPVEVPAEVLEVRGASGSWRVLLRVDRQPADWLYRRRVDPVRLVARRVSGIVVPASSVAVRRGRTGVWVRTRGGATWVAVGFVAQSGDRVAVSGLPEGAAVYRWPRWLHGP